ncbi:helix-turn-helix domain-containing protein [Rosistilla oblonga]|uniref:AraC family transcriptional regulator n=1 Tax=Rosistilla oblonga TaxID=2527990 RepID=UPI003A9869D5
MPDTSIQEKFFARNPSLQSLFALFDALPQTYFYAKDCDSRFVKVNAMFLENHGISCESEALGKTDRDFHPPVMAEAYISEDQRVIRDRRPLPGQIWLVLHRRSVPRWYVSTKTPLLDLRGDVIGIAGAMYRVEQQKELATHLQELLPAARHIEQHYCEPIVMSEMAKLAGLSSTHFNRRFQQLLRMSPTQYLRSIRIQAAQRLLTTSSRTLAEIALDVGYTDQSHLTKRFRETTGITPAAYRKRFVR